MARTGTKRRSGSPATSGVERSPSDRLHDMPPLSSSANDARSELAVPDFEAGRGEGPHPLNRRVFLRLSCSALALSGAVIGCTRAPAEKIVPYRVQPAEIV